MTELYSHGDTEHETEVAQLEESHKYKLNHPYRSLPIWDILQLHDNGTAGGFPLVIICCTTAMHW